MEIKLNNTVRNASLVLVAALSMLSVGCGDGYFSRGGGTFGSSLSSQVTERMDGGEVELSEYTGCEVVETNDPEARCEGVSDTQIEVFVDGKSIIFDFSNVKKGGTLSEADFEGYIVSVTEDSNVPPILQAVLDAANSNVEADELEVQFDDKSVAVNFQGLRYDDNTFVKVDLVFDEAS